jgi:hypothetical protein
MTTLSAPFHNLQQILRRNQNLRNSFNCNFAAGAIAVRVGEQLGLQQVEK